jgi:hypothetical protein
MKRNYALSTQKGDKKMPAFLHHLFYLAKLRKAGKYDVKRTMGNGLEGNITLKMDVSLFFRG